VAQVVAKIVRAGAQAAQVLRRSFEVGPGRECYGARENGMASPPSERTPRELASSTAADFFEMSLDHLCIVGFDGFFIRVNPSWSRTLGWTVDELMARPTIELVHPEDRELTLARRRQLHERGDMAPLVNRYRCKDRSYRWFEWRSIAQIERRVVYAAARDITAQKHMEETLRASREHEQQLTQQLLLADRMASVGTLAAGAAHEINNPLACVMASLEVLLEALPSHGSALPAPSLASLMEMARGALGGAETIRKVVRGLKTFSRATVERRVVIDVGQALEPAVRLTSNEIQQRARLVKEYGPTPKIEADEARLGQVFVNLLVNAAQAIPEGDSSRHEIRIVTSTDEAGRAVIEIRDTGVGIPASAIARVFDPFFTTKPIGTGTGLGLSICHNLVRAIGGTIAVTSEEGRGTVFRVVVPAAAAAPAIVESAAPTASPAVRAKVLVVDDELTIGTSFRRVLREHDVTVVMAATEALALLEAGASFDVILSDLMMPGMSGMELHDELVRRLPEAAARVVFITGGAFTAGANAFLERVPNERLEKPVAAATLRAMVARFVRNTV